MARLGMILLLAAVRAAEGAPDRTAPARPYVWRNVTIGGGGFVTGILFHPRERNLLYARTDVGGAYRWDAGERRWVALTDWISPADNNLTGIESIAVDPADPGRLYLAAGTYSSGAAAILRSGDRGATFQRSDVPFKMGGNESGRFNGERLVVDPNLGKILFFGSRQDGLWRSGDWGATWSRVEGFPAVPDSTPEAPAAGGNGARSRFDFWRQPVGIVCVMFDPASGKTGAATPRLYAAVSTARTNLYVSDDGGTSWTAVARQPIGLLPNHMVFSEAGIIYLSYGKEPGPNTMTDGAVWKYDPKSGDWNNISPLRPGADGERFGYGGLAVDARQPSTVMVATFARWHPHDEIFRSTDGGAHWTALFDRASWDYSAAPYTERRTPHWMGDIEINPLDSDQVAFTTGYGIWNCGNVTASDRGRSTRWNFLNAGLEETVPLALMSPPEGAHLLSGLGDIDGFRHDDLNSSPAGTFGGPRFGNTEDLGFAGRKPSVMVRSGTADSGQVRAALSNDGGRTWRALDREPAGSAGAGSIAVSADGNVIVWTPRRCAPNRTRDRGRTWNVCAGLSAGTRVIADPADNSRFYAVDSRTGNLLASSDGAASFQSVPADIHFQGVGGRGALLFARPGSSGDLWLTLRTAGLFHSTDGGTNFTRIAAVQQAESIGFGKAPPGRHYPALYLSGEIKGVRALFRSDDAGETWVRINDDRHQFGAIGCVTGDPRIFGRVYFATGGRGVIYGDPARTERETTRLKPDANGSSVP